MKVQCYLPDTMLPYLLRCNVSHEIVGRLEGFIRVEIVADGMTLINLVGAADAHGADNAAKAAFAKKDDSLFEQVAGMVRSHAKIFYGVDLKKQSA